MQAIGGMGYEGGLETLLDDYDRESWEYSILTLAIEALEVASKVENEQLSRISELEQHSGTLHAIVKEKSGWSGTIRCRVCGWKR